MEVCPILFLGSLLILVLSCVLRLAAVIALVVVRRSPSIIVRMFLPLLEILESRLVLPPLIIVRASVFVTTALLCFIPATAAVIPYVFIIPVIVRGPTIVVVVPVVVVSAIVITAAIVVSPAIVVIMVKIIFPLVVVLAVVVILPIMVVVPIPLTGSWPLAVPGSLFGGCLRLCSLRLDLSDGRGIAVE